MLLRQVFKKVTSTIYACGIMTKKGLLNFLKNDRHIVHFPCSVQSRAARYYADSIRVSYIRALTCSWKKKLNHERSGKRCGQNTRPSHPIRWLRNIISRQFHASRTYCASATSQQNDILLRWVFNDVQHMWQNLLQKHEVIFPAKAFWQKVNGLPLYLPTH